MGGLGFVHYNNSIEEQISIVKKVKQHELGYVISPIVMGPMKMIGDLDELRVCLSISSF